MVGQVIGNDLFLGFGYENGKENTDLQFKSLVT
jgi:hypothetical protein